MFVDDNEIQHLYKLAMRKQKNSDMGMIGRMDRIQGLTILQAMHNLGMVDDDNGLTITEAPLLRRFFRAIVDLTIDPYEAMDAYSDQLISGTDYNAALELATDKIMRDFFSGDLENIVSNLESIL